MEGELRLFVIEKLNIILKNTDGGNILLLKRKIVLGMYRRLIKWESVITNYGKY